MWKPDREESGIFVRAVGQGSVALRLTMSGANPAWSPDGRQLAFTRRESSRASLQIMDASGGTGT